MTESSTANTPGVTITNARNVRVETWTSQRQQDAIAQVLTQHGVKVQSLANGASYDAGDSTCVIHILPDTALTLTHVSGTCSIENVAATVRLEAVKGSVTLKSIRGDISIENAGSDLFAKEIAGDITCTELQADGIFSAVKGSITIKQSHGDCTVSECASFFAEDIHGDLLAQHVRSLRVSKMLHGDATLHQCENTVIQTAKGDCTIVKSTGDVTMASIDGDVWLRDTRGNCSFERINGSLYAQHIHGNINANIGQDCFVETVLADGNTYAIVANDIIFRVHSPINAQFVAQSEREDAITTHLPLQVDRHRQNLVGVIGKGEATVTLFSHRDILLDSALHEESTAGSGKKYRPKINVTFDGRSIVLDPTILAEVNKHLGGFINKQVGDIAKDFGFQFNTERSHAETWEHHQEENMSTQEDPKEFEERLRDLSDRSSRAARKAAEKIREYSDKAMNRARETDWDAVGREVRSTIEHTISELEIAVKEIVSEFQSPTQATDNKNSTVDSKKDSSATVKRVPIEVDADAPDSTDSLDARRRAILEQLSKGEISLDDAQIKLRNLA